MSYSPWCWEREPRGPSSGLGTGAPGRLFPFCSYAWEMKSSQNAMREFLSSSGFALKACNTLIKHPTAASTVKVIKIPNFLEFLLSPTPTHSATPLAFCQGFWFSIISLTFYIIFLTPSFALAAGHLYQNLHHRGLVTVSLEILIANTGWRRCKITLNFQVSLSFRSLYWKNWPSDH